MALAAAGVGAGCGSNGDEQLGEVREQIVTAQRAFAEGDVDLACRHMTTRAKLLIGFMAHTAASTCDKDLARVRRWMGNGDPDVMGPRPEVIDLDVDGSKAIAKVERPGAAPYNVRLASAGGRWKLDGVFDAGASSFQEFSEVPPDSGPPPAPVSEDGSPVELAGAAKTGQLRFGAEPSSLSVLNAFGRMDVGRCRLHFTLRIAADGTTSTDDFVAEGPKACGDVRACGANVTNSRHKPWTGRITRSDGGELQHLFHDVCLDTCVGLYRGDWLAELVEQDGAWRLRSEEAMVGASGWLIDGDMAARGRSLAFSAK